MKKKLLCLLVHYIFLIGVPTKILANGDGDLNSSYSKTKIGLNYVSSTRITKQRGVDSYGTPLPTFNITGIPAGAIIEDAFLYMAGSTMSSTSFFNLSIRNPLNIVESHTASLIGTTPDACWSYSNTKSFRADIKTIITGNGNYDVSGIPTAANLNDDMNGATIIVIYSDPSANFTGSIEIKDGSVVLVSSNSSKTIGFNNPNYLITPILSRGFGIVSDVQSTGSQYKFPNNVIVSATLPYYFNFYEANLNVALSTFDYNHQFLTQTDCVQWVTAGQYYQVKNIELSNKSIPENKPGGTTVGNLSSFFDGNTSYSYSLISGDGDDDNSYFTISGNTLQTATCFDFETRSTYSIRVRSVSSNGVVTNEIFIITVTDETEMPIIAIAKNITVQLDAFGNAVITEAEIDNGSTDNCTIATITLDKKDFDCTNIGANTVTLTVTDVNGNSDSKTATVTVEDKVKPIVNTQNITVQLDASGNAVITEAEIDNGSTDNCAIATITLDKKDFDCSNIGDNTVTLTVTDVNGNSDLKTATVTVEDKIKPIVNTQNITIQLDASGKATITATEINDGSTDNCAIATMTLDKTTFDCVNIGDNTVTLTVTDVNGNSDSKTATVTVEDKVKPIVVTQNITVQLDALGKAVITEAEIDNGSTDNCTIATITLDKKDFDCTNIGDNTVTLNVTDVNGNSESKTATVTVEDKIKPIVSTQNIIVQLDALGKATITAAEINDGSTDICGIATMTLDKTTFDCANIGDNIVTLTVTDVNGNSDSKTATVTVEDKVKPIVSTQNITVQLDALGKAVITEAEIDKGSTDNCTIATITLDKKDFDCTNIGDNTVTLTVTDVNGNSDSKTATVTVEDKVKPIVNTQNITVQLDASGNAVITEAEIDNGSTDNCAIATITLDKKDFDCSNIGDNTVTLTVTDVNGNSDSKTATVTVEDKIKPIVNTQNITVQLDALGKATITATEIDNGSTDNCGIATITLDKTDFNCSNIGANTVTLTVTDVNGNSESKTATVTVEDKIKPIAITQNITVQLDALGKATITATEIDNGSTDNCGIDEITLDKKDFDCANIGDNTVTLTVTDVNGNSDSKTATVTVEDKIKPIAITQNITVQLDALGKATITATEIDNGSTDNCAIATITLDKTDFNCSNIGDNTVTLTVTDVNGNSDSKTATVTVEDKIKPIVNTQNITVQLDASGNAVITEAEIDNGSTDNCAIAKITLDKTDFDCSNIGDNTVTLTVTDVNGNSDSKTATVTVEDKIKPIAITQNITVQLDALGKATITATEIDNGSTDNCAIATITLDKTDFDCSNIGANTVTLTVADVNGNSVSGTAVVTVKDLAVPTVITQNITVQLDATGSTAVIPALINNGSTDNCSIAAMTLDKTTFDCSNIGANTVTLTVTDVNGNSASNTATVTVEDKINPIVVTQNIIIELDATGNAVLTAAQINNGSTDNCEIATMTLDKTTFDCSNIGDNNLTLNLIDKSGNSAFGTAVVTVKDLTAPTVVSKNITVQLDATGNAAIIPALINNGSTDNCAIATMTLDKTTFDCSNIGDNTVILTVTDVNGNSASKTATVTVEDIVKPIVVTQNTTVQLDAAGSAVITAAEINNGSTDNCSIATMTIDKTNFNCSNIGPNIVTLTVTDSNGNVASKTAIVTVEDRINPVVVTQNITIQLTLSGDSVITAAQINNGSSDNCVIDKMTLDKTTFNCSNLGDNTVTLTVKDKSGNQASATAIVTVLPLSPPVFTSLMQDFCAIENPTVATIGVNSTNVKWFINASSSQPLSSSAALTSGTYYAAIYNGTCYSDRVAVTINVKDALVPTGNAVQYICREKEATITDLITNEEQILWYESASGGLPLSAATVLEDHHNYYASYVGDECESSKRLHVEVVFRYCDVKVYNGISANGDGKNDYFAIEGVTAFPDNKLEIFNSWGSLVFEATRYGDDDNLFRGFANKGLGSGKGLLPFGTYYYVFSFTNHDNKRITKKGFLHLNP